MLGAAQAWGQKGGISYPHAKKLAELFPEVGVDYIMHGASGKHSAPDLMGVFNGGRSQLDRIEATLAGLVEALSSLDRDPREAIRQRLAEAVPQREQRLGSRPADEPPQTGEGLRS